MIYSKEKIWDIMCYNLAYNGYGRVIRNRVQLFWEDKILKENPKDILKNFISLNDPMFLMVLNILKSNICAYVYIKKYLYKKKSTIKLTPFNCNDHPFDDPFGYYYTQKRPDIEKIFRNLMIGTNPVKHGTQICQCLV